MSKADNYVRLLVDFNDAPLDSSEYKSWFVSTAASQAFNVCRILGEDCDSYSFFHKLFGRRVQLERNKLQGGSEPGGLTDDEFGRHIRRRITEWSEDNNAIVQAFFEHVHGERNMNVLLIVDNTDKRTSEDQVDAFQTTMNFTSTYPCSCIIALRDETYDLHANHPPLDAISKHRIFRIQPPRLTDVVSRRLDMMIEYLESHSPDKLQYTLQNGAVVEYPKSDIRNYINKIRGDIFGSNRNVRTLVEAIAGRNIRKALEMFNAIMVSPYLSDKVTGFVGEYSKHTLPERSVIRTLCRGKYTYYSDDRGDAYIHNIFQVPETLASTDNYLIPELLSILVRSRKRTGELSIEGYRLVSKVLQEPEMLAYSEEVILWAINYCYKRGLITAEGTLKSGILGNSYIKISASGFYHLKFLCRREEYISNVAMDTWIRDQVEADRISQTLMSQHPRKRDIPKHRIKRYNIFADYLANESHVHRAASTCDDERLTGMNTIKECIDEIDEHRSQSHLYYTKK